VIGTIFKWLFRLVAILLVLLVVAIIAYRFIMPVSTLMIARYILHEKVERTVVPLSQISEDLIAAVVVSEDARFCNHHGIDWGAMRAVVSHAGKNGVERGASTLTMQTAKNLFLWQGHSYVRKALEIPIAFALDAAWPKRRTLEIYLNIAEWGDGVFGIEAAAQTYFRKHASEINAEEAALLAAILPNPHKRSPVRPSHRVSLHAKIVSGRIDRGAAHLECLR
jgi:monofunctional glycosyltransferase